MPGVETEYRLDLLVQATIGADGTARVQRVGPVAYGERWRVTLFSASGPQIARLQIFRGPNQIDGTEFADNATSNTDIPLQVGETLTFLWSGGVVGTIMQCAVSGERHVKGNRAYGLR